MPPLASTKDNSEMPSKRSISPRDKDQLQPPYPQTLKFAQPRGAQEEASLQPHTGGTRRSSSKGSANRPATYLSVERAWGETAQGDKTSSAVDYSPMSNWERGAGRDEPWNGVAEVPAGVNEGKHSDNWSQSENPVSVRDSNCATKGSSK